MALPRSLPAASSVYRIAARRPDRARRHRAGRRALRLVARAIRSRQAGRLAGQLVFACPWGGPEQVILPGFHTAAENGLRKGHAGGNDMFLSLCGLMSTGARTVLISRWRTGGQTSFDLVREFAQELPHASPAEAWQRSVQVAADTPIEPEREPRVKKASSAGEPPKAGHPFFWAGYMLVDSGPGADVEHGAGSADAVAPANPPQPRMRAKPANPPRRAGQSPPQPRRNRAAAPHKPPPAKSPQESCHRRELPAENRPARVRLATAGSTRHRVTATTSG